MNKIQAVIEITNEKVRLVAGHVIDNEPVIIYSASKEIKGMVSGNIIVNHDALVTAIKQITYIESPELKMKLKINYATIILPPIGFFLLLILLKVIFRIVGNVILIMVVFVVFIKKT